MNPFSHAAGLAPTRVASHRRAMPSRAQRTPWPVRCPLAASPPIRTVLQQGTCWERVLARPRRVTRKRRPGWAAACAAQTRWAGRAAQQMGRSRKDTTSRVPSRGCEHYCMTPLSPTPAFCVPARGSSWCFGEGYGRVLQRCAFPEGGHPAAVKTAAGDARTALQACQHDAASVQLFKKGGYALSLWLRALAGDFWSPSNNHFTVIYR